MDSTLVKIANSLVDDALDLLPKSVSVNFAPGDDITALMHGVEDGPATTPQLNDDPQTMGRMLALMVITAYRGLEAAPVIPQVVFYEGYTILTTSDLSIKAADIRTDKERYSKALNITVNMMLTAAHAKAGPRVGVYLRDSKNNLYLYETGQ